MIRMNITVPEDVAEKLNKVKNKSRYIAQAVLEKIKKDEMDKLKNDLIEGYKASYEEDKKEAEFWDCTLGDGLD